MLRSREMQIVESELDMTCIDHDDFYDREDPIKDQEVWFPNQGRYSLKCCLSMYGIKPYAKFRPSIIDKSLWRKIIDFVCTNKNWGE